MLGTEAFESLFNNRRTKAYPDGEHGGEFDGHVKVLFQTAMADLHTDIPAARTTAGTGSVGILLRERC